MPKISFNKSQSNSSSSIAKNTNQKTSSGENSSQSTMRTLLAPNTNIGQHFLKNPAVVDSIVSKSGIRPTGIIIIF